MSNFKLDTNFKKIYDNIHGFIKMSNWAMEIVDTKYFQRLRYLHQLGTCYYVFPNATHTRFEHSIGTYFLVDCLLNSIKKSTDKKYLNEWLSNVPELQNYYLHKSLENDVYLDDYVCELLKLSGLCHDLGHGPFSHVFDDVFIKEIRKGKKSRECDVHENRSGSILEHIINSTQLNNVIDSNGIQLIKNIINPSNENQGFIYQIVSNSLNSVDVDKCDYIARDTYAVGLKYSFDFRTVIDDVIVINNIISYPKQLYYEVACLFMTRYRLHKQIYCHKSVISSQFMINEIMLLIDPILKIYDCVNDVDKFTDLTDCYILESVKYLNKMKLMYGKDNQERIDKAMIILNKIEKCDFYKFIGTIVTKLSLGLTYKSIIELDNELTPESFLIFNSKIGFVSGNKTNPLNNIYFYDRKQYKKNPTSHETIKKERISAFLPDTYQENLIMLFATSSTDNVTINKLTGIYNILLEQIEIDEEEELLC